MRCKDTTLFSKNKEFYRKNIATIAELRYFILDLTACLSPCDVKLFKRLKDLLQGTFVLFNYSGIDHFF